MDVYSVGYQAQEKPFQHALELVAGTGGERTRRVGTFDGGALIGGLCWRTYERMEEGMRRLAPSKKILRMADGNLVPSRGVWIGMLRVEEVSVRVRLEVFDSGGCWEILVGKPVLRQLKAVHDYWRDTVTIGEREGGESVRLESQAGGIERDEKAADGVAREEGVEWMEGDAWAVGVEKGVLTRATEPFKKERVEAVVREVRIGEDLTGEQKGKVLDLIREFADCFALSLSEVNAVPGAVHKLKIPEGATFSTKVGQRKLTPAQRLFHDAKIDEMLEAGVIRQIHPSEVKCAAPTVLAPKPYENGLPLAELQHMVNDQCVAHGLPQTENLPERPEPAPHSNRERAPRWRICHNFTEINRTTEIAPMPQGDIRQKQQNLSGHRYIHVFDFAAGFYAVTVDPESQPYITFYVEGRGYFAYRRMPFGVTGGPSEFAHLTALRMHDLVADGTCELFVDDGGSSADTFAEGMDKLRRVLMRVRRERMSLAPGKMRIFMTEAVFGGATVGPKGVSPDTGKLTTVVNWPIPRDASHLEGFLGLTSWYRNLISGYGIIEKPLRDILKGVVIPAGTKKAGYQRLMKAYKIVVGENWKEEHTRAFMALKARLVAEPVLRAPQFDGTPFILTTDGCKDAFAGVLAQRFRTTLPGGKTVQRLHPIGFVSKRTSPSEENYKPFLLEFAALKYSLDKFADIIYGYPVEVETDCQALRDVLLSEKLNSTYVRWRDGVVAHNIVAVRHIPGTINIADGLSRHYEGIPKGGEDGSGYSVDPDWEQKEGLREDVLGVEEAGSKEADDGLGALKGRFKDDTYFLDIIEALVVSGPGRKGRLRDKQRARHRAVNYMVDDGKLWFVGGGTAVRAVARRECVTKKEAGKMAQEEHERGGHWHRDGIKIALADRIHRPGLDEIIRASISECAKCKNFGATHIHALLQPITRRHPFELLVGDYLKLPVGKGGYHTVGLYLDVFSQHVWGYKLKKYGSAATTVRSLEDIFHTFAPSEVFMSDGGKHFDNAEVKEACKGWGVRQEVVAAYSPWVNGLVEGTNKLLLYVLARLCAPEVGEDGWSRVDWEELPKSWPDHFEKAIRILNWRILPALKFSPKELLLGLVVNTAKTPLAVSSSIITPDDIDRHMTYATQQRLDGYGEAVRHAIRRKATFDRRVEAKGGEVVFEVGQLVQVHRSDLYNTLSSERKLKPMWSEPKRVRARLTNAYELEELDGSPVSGRFSARRLREFVPREGTQLHEETKRGVGEASRREGESGESTAGEVEMGKEEGEHREEGERSGDKEDEREEQSEAEDEEEEEEATVAGRLKARRRGRRHFQGGHME